MSFESVVIFVIYNYMREILNIKIWKVNVNYKSLIIERQYYIFVTCAR